MTKDINKCTFYTHLSKWILYMPFSVRIDRNTGRSYDLERGQGLPTRARGDQKRLGMMTLPGSEHWDVGGTIMKLSCHNCFPDIWTWQIWESVRWISYYVQICLLRLFRKLIMICLLGIRWFDETLIVVCQRGRRSSDVHIRCFRWNHSFFEHALIEAK